MIAANQAPDHATIARFRARHERGLAELFAQVLGLSARAGIVEAGLVSVDSTKLAAAASERQTRDYERIAQEIVAEAGRIDAAEDEIHGPARGDELPRHVARREGRQAWIKEALGRQQEQREAKQTPIPKARSERLELCRSRLVSDWRTERQAHRDYAAWRKREVRERGRQAMGPGPKPASPPPQPKGKINLTDPDSRNMKTPRGYLQGYNAQLVATERQIVIAAEITTSGSDFQSLEPMTSAAERELEAAGAAQRPDTVLADAGYWANGHIDALRAREITPLIAPDAHSRAGPRRGAGRRSL